MKWDGLAELYKQLENLPADLTAEAAHIVEGVANAAALEIRSAYPVHSGNLRESVFVTHFDRGRYSAGAQVKATAHHAWIFENGTAARAYYTKNGVRHETGAMPPGHVFVPIVMKHRRLMYTQFAALLERHGLTARIDDALAA
jgi:hypothetical protein